MQKLVPSKRMLLVGGALLLCLGVAVIFGFAKPSSRPWEVKEHMLANSSAFAVGDIYLAILNNEPETLARRFFTAQEPQAIVSVMSSLKIQWQRIDELEKKTGEHSFVGNYPAALTIAMDADGKKYFKQTVQIKYHKVNSNDDRVIAEVVLRTDSATYIEDVSAYFRIESVEVNDLTL